MKTRMGVLAVFAAVLSAQAEMVSVVQITDMQGQVGFEIKTREEFAALQKEINEETAVFPAAKAEAQKEWGANKDNKMAFQGNRVRPRSAKKVGADFADRDKADKKRSQLEEHASEKLVEEMDKAAKRAKQAGKGKEEEMAKEEARAKAFSDAYAMISKLMADKLGRPVPGFGFAAPDAKKEGAKKDEKKEKKEKKEKEEKK